MCPVKQPSRRGRSSNTRVREDARSLSIETATPSRRIVLRSAAAGLAIGLLPGSAHAGEVDTDAADFDAFQAGIDDALAGSGALDLSTGAAALDATLVVDDGDLTIAGSGADSTVLVLADGVTCAFATDGTAGNTITLADLSVRASTATLDALVDVGGYATVRIEDCSVMGDDGTTISVSGPLVITLTDAAE